MKKKKLETKIKKIIDKKVKKQGEFEFLKKEFEKLEKRVEFLEKKYLIKFGEREEQSEEENNKEFNSEEDVFTNEEVERYKQCMYENLLKDDISIGVAKISRLTKISLAKARAIKKYLHEQEIIDTVGKTKTKVIKF